MTTNGVESINARLRDERQLPIVALLESLQKLTTSWFARYRNASIVSTTNFTPAVESILRERYNAARCIKFLNWASTRSVLGKWVYLVTLAMSLFDLQDVCTAIGSLATLDLPMVVDLIGIYGLKGPYCTLTTTNWFLQALSVIPRGSWGDVTRRSYHDPMGKSGIVIPEPQWLWAHG
ncbi:hypothetical protein F511_03200 [Dorcoceras hygrometricum]|uniref:Uncharacterized protein n=1 Tax=Dorcoceras hygrometricum TaxID=472368 RepID=A0A2Z7CZD6_9LAMI|nr:hypothetical protein F511_03200 [Dorcoceras hygrometricum]